LFYVICRPAINLHRFEPQARPKAWGTGIFSSAGKVADGFIALIGHDDYDAAWDSRASSTASSRLVLTRFSSALRVM